MTRLAPFLALVLAVSLHAAPIPIAPRDIVPDVFTDHNRPAVVATTNGRTFLVAWEDWLMGAWPQTSTVHVRTYDAQGVAEQALPKPVAASNYPGVVWNGSEWIIASTYVPSRFDTSPTQLLVATRVSEHATESSERVELARTQTRDSGMIGAATNGSDLFIGNFGNAVVTTSDLQPRMKLAQALRPLAAAGDTFVAQARNAVVIVSRGGEILQSIPASGSVAATSDGHEYAIVTIGGEELIVNADGTIVKRFVLAAKDNAISPAIVRSGSAYLAGWIEGLDICFTRFDASASGPVVRETMNAKSIGSLALADNGSTTLAAWSSWDGARSHVLTSVTPSGAIPQLQPHDAATMRRPQMLPRLDVDPAGVTAAWTDGYRIYLGGIDRNTAQTRTARVIAEESDRVSSVRVSRARNATLVVWSHATQLAGKVIPDGDGPSYDVTLGSAVTAEVASDGERWLVVWTVGAPAQMRGTIVTAQGTVVSPGGTPLAPSDDWQDSVGVASRGTDFLIAWTEPHVNGTRLLARGISPEGTPTGGVMDLAGGPIARLEIAASGRLYLIVVAATNIGFPVTSIVPDILVAGVPESSFHVRPRDGGFAVLHGTPLRATFVDALGNHVDGGELPDTASVEWAFDFVYDGPRLAIANMLYEGWGYEVVVDLFAPRRRPK